ncbi:MAG: SPOR domain-containing protein [Polyangiaceae bacterium]
MSEPGSLRDIENLEEQDGEVRVPPGVTMALVGLGGACVVFAALALGGRSSEPRPAKSDPLGDLVAQRVRESAGAGARPATELSPSEVTFPGVLSDDPKTTTALAAVRGNPGSAASFAAHASPPPATDRLPVVPVAPLPAQAVLEATPIVTRPRDPLMKAATDAVQASAGPSSIAPAAPGREGGYQLQVSSFRTQSEAQGFADQLRARGHRAYAVEAHVPGRGTWFRVRIGPFGTQQAAAAYRTGFEVREHVVPFVVPPETVARAH